MNYEIRTAQPVNEIQINRRPISRTIKGKGRNYLTPVLAVIWFWLAAIVSTIGWVIVISIVVDKGAAAAPLLLLASLLYLMALIFSRVSMELMVILFDIEKHLRDRK